jgi:hypothetical protein
MLQLFQSRFRLRGNLTVYRCVLLERFLFAASICVNRERNNTRLNCETERRVVLKADGNCVVVIFDNALLERDIS